MTQSEVMANSLSKSCTEIGKCSATAKEATEAQSGHICIYFLGLKSQCHNLFYSRL